MKIAQYSQPISIAHLLPENANNKHFYSNGYSKLFPRLKLKVHTDIEQCYRLWEMFTPKRTIFDLWEFRYAWYEAFRYELSFYTVYEGKKALGILPLWYNEKIKKYEWFGGYWMESQNFFVTDEKFIDVLIALIPNPVQLQSLEQFDGIDKLQIFGTLNKDPDPKFTKSLRGISSIDELLATYKKKERQHMRADYNRIMAYDPRVTESDGTDFAVFDEMIRMNHTRWNGKNRGLSTFFDVREQQAFRYFIRSNGNYSSKYIKTKIQNRTASIDLIFTYKDIYYQFCGSNDVGRFNGIGNFMVYMELEDAIRKGFKMVDCLQEDHSWKHQFFDLQELYFFEK